jgi:hypothetical protein
MSGAPLLATRTGRVVAVVAGVLPSSHSGPHQPLGFAVPLEDLRETWPDFAPTRRGLD